MLGALLEVRHRVAAGSWAIRLGYRAALGSAGRIGQLRTCARLMRAFKMHRLRHFQFIPLA